MQHASRQIRDGRDTPLPAPAAALSPHPRRAGPSARLTDHYIISGSGRVGQRAATQLAEKGRIPFVVVDTNPATIAIARDLGLLCLEGDATRITVLEGVGIRRARGLLACADSDVNNVCVTLSARTLNPGLYIVARAGDPDAKQKLYSVGASRVVSPYTHGWQSYGAPCRATAWRRLY